MVGVSILQLDTNFPRIAGDVAAPETYKCDVEVIRIPRADVKQIVRSDPQKIEIAPFLNAAKTAKGQVVVTSCGFLSPFQDQIQTELDRPFIASSLNGLPGLMQQSAQHGVGIVTFDADKLTDAHFPIGIERSDLPTIGLRDDSHLRQVIQQDRPDLNFDLAKTEVLRLLKDELPAHIQTLVLECTNLPPYKSAIQQMFKIQTFDILDMVEQLRPESIADPFL